MKPFLLRRFAQPFPHLPDSGIATLPEIESFHA
jgi:hypothetical protein